MHAPAAEHLSHADSLILYEYEFELGEDEGLQALNSQLGATVCDAAFAPLTTESLSSVNLSDFAVWEEQIAQEESVITEQPLIFEVPKMESDKRARRRAERLIGQIATSGSVELVTPFGGEIGSLHEAIWKARAGDVAARKLVETNVRTDMIERTIKAGHIMEVQLDVGQNGSVQQYGQTAESIQANSLRFASGSWQMRERTETETVNMYRIEDLYGQGVLDDYVFVVFSRVASNMSTAALGEAGFFTDTMSCAIQATTIKRKSLTIESAFVAGKKTRDAEPHDAATVARVGDELGVDLAGSSTQVLGKPLLIRKSLMPNGVIDLVRWYDTAAGGTFFGKAEPVRDYIQFREHCRRREQELEPTVQEIVEQLLAEAGSILVPTDATSRLAELSEEKMLKRAVTDESVDGMVFGFEAASFLEAARYYHSQGDAGRADLYLKKALEVAESSSCPGGATKRNGAESLKDDITDKLENIEEDDLTTPNTDRDCEYVSKKCPMCGTENVRTTDKGIGGGKRCIRGSCGCSKVYTKKRATEYALAA